MKALKIIRNYVCYCGIEKDDYNALKKDAYISNFRVWRVLHILMAVVFAFLYISTFFSRLMRTNSTVYLAAFLYSAAAICLFFLLRKDSLAAQLVIYLSISLLFLFSGFLTQNNPYTSATSFIVLLLITPMFMIDKPYFMALELCVASSVFLAWMHAVKPYDVWRIDLINVVVYTFVGILLHVIANSIRIREFVLTREINIQKDMDEMTGLRNKGALTREINAFLADTPADKGILFLLDVDCFKSINDTYGHDTGDSVIHQLGVFLASRFTGNEITGRFGGDEFVIFVRGTDDLQEARGIADSLVAGVSENIRLPDPDRRISISIGIATCDGREKNYSGIFKKADTALYQAKADPVCRYRIWE